MMPIPAMPRHTHAAAQARSAEVQRQAEASVEAAREDCATQLQRHSTVMRGELNGLRGKVGLHGAAHKSAPV